MAGWTIGYLANTDNADWQSNLETIVAELLRVLKPGGTTIILETDYRSDSPKEASRNTVKQTTCRERFIPYRLFAVSSTLGYFDSFVHFLGNYNNERRFPLRRSVWHPAL